MLRHQPRQEAGVAAARDAVARRDRAEGPGVVDKAGGLVESRRSGRRLPETDDRIGLVDEPPRHPHVHRPVPSGQRRQFAGVDRLIDGEGDQVEAGGVAVGVQQRLQGTRELHRRGNVPAHIRAVAGQGPGVVVAEHGRVQRHHQSVVHRQPCLVIDHVPPQPGGVAGVNPSRQGAAIQHLRLRVVQALRARIRMGMVGGDRPALLEEGPTAPHRLHMSGVGRYVLVCGPPQRLGQLPPVGPGRLQVGIGPEGGDHPTVPIGVGGQGAMVGQIRAGVIRGRQYGNVEALIQRPGRELGRVQGGVDLVVDVVRGGGRRAHLHPEYVVEDLGEPGLHRRTRQPVPVLAQQPECCPRLLRTQLAAHRHAQVRQLHPGQGVQQPVGVVIRGQQQAGGVGEGDVLGQPLRRDMPVGGDDGRVGDLGQQFPGHATRSRIGGQQPVGIEGQRLGRGRGGHEWAPDSWCC